MNTPAKITALLITLNGERLLAPCLDSLAFCDRIVIIDSFSTDKTKEIALEHKTIFIENPFKNYDDQINYGIEWIKNNMPSEWIFFMDCDEICSTKLRESILQTLETNNNISAYKIPRKTWYYGRFLVHGGHYPDSLYRLFKPHGIIISSHNGHPTFTPTGASGEFENYIAHYTYASFYNQMDKLNIYAERAAISMRKKGKKGGICIAFLHASWRFTSMYLLKRGFLDGKAGFLMSMHASMYTFLKYIRIDEGDWGYPYTHGLEDKINDSHNTNQKD